VIDDRPGCKFNICAGMLRYVGYSDMIKELIPERLPIVSTKESFVEVKLAHDPSSAKMLD